VRGQTLARMAHALDSANREVRGEQLEDLERWIMRDLGMDAHEMIESIAGLAAVFQVDPDAAVTFFLWGCRTTTEAQTFCAESLG
jgi:hypothetical protein